jgi:rhamnosyltransferase
MTLAGVIILHNPSTEVFDNILSYIDQLSKLYVIDNSDTKDQILFDRIKQLSPKCEIVINTGNCGIATALNQAVEFAIRDGFEWLLTMDQDSSFENDSYFDAFQHYEGKNSIALFSPEICENENIENDQEKVEFITLNDIAYTSGSIINLKICKEIGKFNEKLFIDAVDTDYCLRLLKNKYQLIKIKGATLNHKLGYLEMVRLPFNKRKYLSFHSPIRHYYIIRNHTYILFKYILSNPKIVFQNYYRVLKKFSFAILFHPDKLKVIKYAIIGLYHFLTNRYGKL